MSRTLSKLVDIIIINKQSKHLDTSDLQFGFKQNSSTVQCSFVVKESIDYYCLSEGNVYATVLDASKAFDRLNFDNLFESKVVSKVYMSDNSKVTVIPLYQSTILNVEYSGVARKNRPLM